jgi:hypothetical protein
MEYIHGWSAQQVQTLQQQTAQALGLAVEFSDRLKDGSRGSNDGGHSQRAFPDGITGRNGTKRSTNAGTKSK